ncbi:MAG: sugar phosphate isomerase/epimerase family protein, partial [Verrucomicrobiales bacterium]
MAGFSTAALVAGQASVLGQAGGKTRKMTKCLSCGAIGVAASQEQAIALAAKHGFESVEADSGFWAGLDQAAADDLVGEMKEKGLELGYSGLPVDFRRDEETFERGLGELPKKAAGLKRAGLKRVGTWLMPCHNELTYLANFKQHTERLREVAKVLGDSGLMLGFEYVGTATLMASRKYPFLHTMAETRELNAAIGTGNVGLVLDSWHWWQAGDTAEAIRELRSDEIALVDLNDAPKG